MVTRAKADIFKPLERMNFHVTTTSPLPRSHVHALHDSNWKEAMLDEYNALITNGTWVLVPRQQQGIDCDETFSLVVKPATNRTVLSLAVSRNCPIHQLDVKNSFLHGTLPDTVYMHQPPGFVDSAKLDYWTASVLFLSQSKFAEEILKKSHMQHCNPCRTPIDTESKLGPDVCLNMHDPREPHLAALKRITRYVRGTLDHGIQLHVSTTTQLTAYTDADWAGCPVTRRSTSGAEAEYQGVANVVAKTAWICNLLLELHAPLHTATLV
nr:ribonuclease H-like domain-containing protein [Tanacetum cinerariifolium]